MMSPSHLDIASAAVRLDALVVSSSGRPVLNKVPVPLPVPFSSRHLACAPLIAAALSEEDGQGLFPEADQREGRASSRENKSLFCPMETGTSLIILPNYVQWAVLLASEISRWTRWSHGPLPSRRFYSERRGSVRERGVRRKTRRAPP